MPLTGDGFGDWTRHSPLGTRHTYSGDVLFLVIRAVLLVYYLHRATSEERFSGSLVNPASISQGSGNNNFQRFSVRSQRLEFRPFNSCQQRRCDVELLSTVSLYVSDTARNSRRIWSARLLSSTITKTRRDDTSQRENSCKGDSSQTRHQQTGIPCPKRRALSTAGRSD